MQVRHRYHLVFAVISLSISMAGGCGGSGSSDDPDPQPPAKGAIGSDCSDNNQCDSRYCATDALFPGGYCLANCDEQTSCPEGSTCSAFFTYHWCLDDCGSDDDCRDDYLCQYGVCRPSCAGEDAYCLEGDRCSDDGRCQGPCKTDDECSPNRCQDGQCVPPCQNDDDCLPGFGCETTTGACAPKAGKAMGEACSRPGPSDECATGYCLPSRKICSIICQGSSKCPGDYACGLETFDGDLNGKLDDALAGCIPHVGSTAAGALCAADSDCLSGHCYNGFCMEGCVDDTFCASDNQCVGTQMILDAAIVRYKGCLPREGSSVFTLGTFDTTDYHGFDVPENATSIVITTEIDTTEEVAALGSLADPDGEALFQLPDQCSYFSQRNRYYFDVQISTIQVPNTSAVTLKSGIYTYSTATSAEGYPVTVKLYTRLGNNSTGTIDINWGFVDLSNHPCISGPTLNAASAPNHSWFTRQRTALMSILQRANIQIGDETFFDVNATNLDILDIDPPAAEQQLLFQKSASRSAGSLTFFFVRDIQAGFGGEGGMVLGLSGGIPGPPVPGKVNSGIAISMQTACFEQYGYNPGHTMAHEIGHFLGLSHNVESEFNPGFDSTTDEVVCPCPCGENMVCQKGWSDQWCRGLDHLPDTDGNSSNLMFWAAESTQDFEGNQLSAGQVRVMLDNPLVK